jgi:multicomponent Na+:H+ antiporter subunit D
MTAPGLHALPLVVVLVSLLAGLAIAMLGEGRPRLRTVLNLAAAVLKLGLVVLIALLVTQGVVPEFRFPLVPGFDIVLRADSLSILFASLSAVLWLITTVYAVAYMEHYANRARFFGFFSICVTATMGIAMAGNLLTFFVFYELLTLATWPLVVHTGSPAALRAGRTYLQFTLGGSALFLVGLIWLYALAGTQDFIAGGSLALVELDAPSSLRAIFVLVGIGMGVKAALVPLHSWLPTAMVAPAPVSALLHAVAVVKAGAFGLVRLVEDVFGTTLTTELGMGQALAIAASFTIVYGSVLALQQGDLKRRLAYSTVSQVSYIALGIAVGGPIATVGGMVHLVHQGVMKITMFFCAGTFATFLGVTRIDELDGLARRLPWTAAAFSVAAMGMIGLPPMAGFVSKWYLGAGAVAVGQTWVVAVLVASTLLNAAYFLPIVARMWLRPAPERWPDEAQAGPWLTAGLVLPALATAGLTIAFGVFAGSSLSPLDWAIAIAREYVP